MNKKEIEKIRKEMKERSSGSFKEALKIVFAKKNMWMLAIGVIIGGAISAIIQSIANDLIMAPISHALGFKDIGDFEYGGVAIGKFLSAIINFIVLSLTLLIMVFVVVFAYKSIIKKYGAKNIQELKEAKPTTQQLILEELRELNKNTVKLVDGKKTKKLRNS